MKKREDRVLSWLWLVSYALVLVALVLCAVWHKELVAGTEPRLLGRPILSFWCVITLVLVTSVRTMLIWWRRRHS